MNSRSLSVQVEPTSAVCVCVRVCVCGREREQCEVTQEEGPVAVVWEDLWYSYRGCRKQSVLCICCVMCRVLCVVRAHVGQF